MIKLTLSKLLPTIKLIPPIKVLSCQIYTTSLIHKSKLMYCVQKKQPSHQKIQNQKKQQDKKKKLIDMTNQQLIQLNTSQALKIVENSLGLQKKKNQQMENKIKEFQQRLKIFQQIDQDNKSKQQRLAQNNKQAKQQLQRIENRMKKQIQNSKDYAITKLAKQLIQVADCLKRCSKQAQELLKTNSNHQFLQKILQSQNHMIQLLKQYQIQQFDPINQPFDPNTSQSLLTIPCPPGYIVNNVATTMQTGYKIKDRLLRSARVGIFV